MTLNAATSGGIAGAVLGVMLSLALVVVAVSLLLPRLAPANDSSADVPTEVKPNPMQTARAGQAELPASAPAAQQQQQQQVRSSLLSASAFGALSLFGMLAALTMLALACVFLAAAVSGPLGTAFVTSRSCFSPTICITFTVTLVSTLSGAYQTVCSTTSQCQTASVNIPGTTADTLRATQGLWATAIILFIAAFTAALVTLQGAASIDALSPALRAALARIGCARRHARNVSRWSALAAVATMLSALVLTIAGTANVAQTVRELQQAASEGTVTTPGYSLGTAAAVFGAFAAVVVGACVLAASLLQLSEYESSGLYVALCARLLPGARSSGQVVLPPSQTKPRHQQAAVVTIGVPQGVPQSTMATVYTPTATAGADNPDNDQDGPAVKV